MASDLSLAEREQIRVGIEHDWSCQQIASSLGRHRSTITREINRNNGRAHYRAATADACATRNRRRPRLNKLAAHPHLAKHVAKRLRAHDSPMRISHELANGTFNLDVTVSHTTIRTAARTTGHGLPTNMWRSLPAPHKTPRPRNRPAPQPLGTIVSIHDRPQAANDRTQVGHLEGDLIIGANNQSAAITIFDRASRKLWLAPLPHGRTADHTSRALIKVLKRIPADHRHTLTWDQGREMAAWRQTQTATGIAIYFADPHSPWQRPTNENGNRLIRRWLPKGTNLATITTTTMRTIEHRINTIPRRIHNWHTANHAYHQLTH